MTWPGTASGCRSCVPGAVKTPLVNTVEIAGVDREDPTVSRWVDRFGHHAVSPEKAAEKIFAGVAKNRYLIYTSQDIRALYAFKQVGVVALQRRDAPGERHLYAGTSAQPGAALKLLGRLEFQPYPE